MSYFTAVMSRADDRFHVLDLAVEDVGDLAELADLIEGAGDDSGEGEAIAVIEHEDEWFALIRVLGSDAAVFLSDVDAVASSPYAELFADYLDSRPDEYEEDDVVVPDDEDDEDSEDDADEDEPQMLDFDTPPTWSGDPGLFSDDGVTADELVEQLERHTSDPARVVAHVGEAVGFADVLEAAR
ncbi:tRNA adenosine deaminase-associated protein [Brevibacterium yomogidense]|uniref:tRNA adenosine deaminase-associated protein n=1 Tax=Brevibacterium yomogidense TaxID=946573 RepID=UPI0018E01ED3|nr:tRNA adenosine deaminase-associated protein [Brevibacterium yomogidense]